MRPTASTVPLTQRALEFDWEKPVLLRPLQLWKFAVQCSSVDLRLEIACAFSSNGDVSGAACLSGAAFAWL